MDTRKSLVCTAVLLALAASSDPSAQDPQADRTFRSRVDLITVDVVAVDEAMVDVRDTRMDTTISLRRLESYLKELAALDGPKSMILVSVPEQTHTKNPDGTATYSNFRRFIVQTETTVGTSR